MIRYFDASAPQSATVDALLKSADAATSRLSEAEIAATVMAV